MTEGKRKRPTNHVKRGEDGQDRYLWYKKFEEIIKLFNYFKNVSEQACERSEQASERTGFRKGYLIILKSANVVSIRKGYLKLDM